MPESVTLVEWQRDVDLFRCIVADAMSRKHTVEIPHEIVSIDPKEFRKGSDIEHIGIIAAGTVLMSIDRNTIFHKVDRSMVNRAYIAASHAQILGKFE